MNDDIVLLLRALAEQQSKKLKVDVCDLLVNEAANEIERLRKALQETTTPDRENERG